MNSNVLSISIELFKSQQANVDVGSNIMITCSVTLFEYNYETYLSDYSHDTHKRVLYYAKTLISFSPILLIYDLA